MWLVFGSSCHALGFPGASELTLGSWLTPLGLPDSGARFGQVPPFSSVDGAKPVGQNQYILPEWSEIASLGLKKCGV